MGEADFINFRIFPVLVTFSAHLVEPVTLQAPHDAYNLHLMVVRVT